MHPSLRDHWRGKGNRDRRFVPWRLHGGRGGCVLWRTVVVAPAVARAWDMIETISTFTRWNQENSWQVAQLALAQPTCIARPRLPLLTLCSARCFGRPSSTFGAAMPICGMAATSRIRGVFPVWIDYHASLVCPDAARATCNDCDFSRQWEIGNGHRNACIG